MVQGYCTKEAMEWALNYVEPSNPTGVPMCCHEGRLTGKGTIRKKVITLDPLLFCYVLAIIKHRFHAPTCRVNI
jgi:hypothetical protein